VREHLSEEEEDSGSCAGDHRWGRGAGGVPRRVRGAYISRNDPQG